MVLGKNQFRFIRFVTHLRARCRACGFTLIELMVTLAVAAILAVIAVPSFRHIIVETNLSDINNDLAGDLQFARTQAVSRQTTVAVAQSSGGSWQDGWRVQIPPAGATAAIILRSHPAIPAQYVVNPAGATSVIYQPQGTLAPAPAAPTATGVCFTISASSGSQNQPRYLQALPAGMIQQTTGGSSPPTSPDCLAPAP